MVQVVGEKMAGYSLADVVRALRIPRQPPKSHVDSVDKKKSGEANRNILYTHNIYIYGFQDVISKES